MNGGKIVGMKMKKMIIRFGVIVLIAVMGIGVGLMIRNKTMDYKKFADKKCGFEISQYLEYDKGTVGLFEEHFSLQFKVKKGCETELENILESKYSDMIGMDDTVRISNSSMSKLIKTGTKRHIYVFFKSGKHKKTVEINMCIVDIDGQQYAFLYTI